MEVKSILEKIRHQEEGRKEYFFALEICPNAVKGAIWLLEQGNISVVSVGLGQKWSDEEELVKTVDACLSSAVESFTDGQETKIEEPNKVIFGLPSNWVEEEKIIPDKITLLRNLSKELELEPVGFVVITEAIVHYLKTIEGVPLTAILVDLSKDKVGLTVVKLGRIEPSQEMARSENLGDDVVEGLSRYGEEEPFPSRVLLYDGDQEKIEEAKQELLDYPWQEDKALEKNVNFLHLPKVEVLSNDFDIKAVALAGGKEVVQASGITADFSKEEKAARISGKEAEEAQPEAEEITTTDNFGFFQNEDILEKEPLLKSEEEPLVDQETKTKVSPPAPGVVGEMPTEQATPSDFEESLPIKKKIFPWKFDFSRFKNLKLAITSILPKPSFGPKTSKRWPLIMGIVGMVLLILGGIAFLLYWRLSKASVVILVEPRRLEEKLEIKLDPNVSIPNMDELVLPAKEIETVVEGEKTADTTGTKIVGEKAKGTVTIFNGTPKEKTFSSGTILASSSGIKFTLDGDVTVASRSSVLEPPGKAQIGATAEKIGSEANLAAGTEFTIANYSKSDYAAQNETAFSGGTSREVQVVAEKDQTQLLADLTKELEAQSPDKLKPLVGDEQKLLEQSVKSSAIEKEFSKKIDEEATQITLKLKLKVTGLAYSESEMRDLLEEKIKEKIPEGYQYDSQETTTDFNFLELTSKGVAIFSVNFVANLIPQLDLEKIKNDLKGKYLFLGKSHLDNIPGVVGSEVKIEPPLPDRLLTFPRQTEKIQIEVKIGSS